MSTEDLLGRLDEHRASTQKLHADLKNHVKGNAAKVAEADKLTHDHADSTDKFHHDALVLVRPTDQPVGGSKDPNVLVRPMTPPPVPAPKP